MHEHTHEERRTFLKLAALGAGAALVNGVTRPRSAGARHANGEPAKRLVIRALRIPDVVFAGGLFDVSLAISDPLGVQEVELLYGGRGQKIPADGVTEAVVTARLLAGEAGYHELEAVAVGVDGARGEPARALVAVGDHTSDEPADAHGEVDELIGAWQAAGGDPFALYERGPLYQRGLPTRALEERARRVRNVDANRDRLLIRAPLLKRDFLRFNWWRSWMAGGGPQRFDWETHCGPSTAGVTPAGEVLQCWLELHPQVRSKIYWKDVDPSTGQVTLRLYDDWPVSLKNGLNTLFYVYWTWLEGGLGEFQGLELPPVQNNAILLSDGQPAVTRFTAFNAQRLYLQTLAHSLAIEIGGFVPWSVLNYMNSDLDRLFTLGSLFHSGHFERFTVEDPTPVVFNGYWPQGNVTPAPPTKTFRWLVENDILRPTHYDTIARLLKWGREHMLHFAGNATAGNMFNHWQYRGNPPVARILDLTQRISPPGGPGGWAQGCHGVAFFMQSLLRAVNIPVTSRFLVDPDQGAAHRSPVFHTVGQALSHGDDVYDVKFNIPSVDPDYLPSDALFISWQTFTQWFPGSVEAQTANVGRQVREIALDILPNKLMDIYCDDLQAFKTHAQSGVFNIFDRNYTVVELEAMGLWTRLAAKEAEHDFCDEPRFRASPRRGPSP